VKKTAATPVADAHRAADPHRAAAKRGRPRQATPRVVHPNAGGADIGATHVYAAVAPERTPEPVQVFETFTEDLYRLAAWFKEHGVTSVAMESTGVFWIPVFQILESCGLEVYLVNARHVKNVPGRKTDVSDCQWLQYLHAVGLLQASFRPPAEICAVRSLLRHRGNVVAEGAKHIQHMQKSLTQMSLHLHHVLDDLSGVSGLAIVDAILAGERDPKTLAQLRDRRVKAPEETVRKSLVGDYRPAHVFTLRQAREAYRFSRTQLQECDAEIERLLAELAAQVDPEETPPPPAPPRQAPRKGQIDLPERDLRTELYRILGTDVTRTPGLDVNNVCQLVAELGPDLKASFANSDRFVSWQALCPNPKVSGGKVLKNGTRKVKHRVATIFRIAAQTLHHSHLALGAFYRRMRSKLGAPKAITATAHKLARIYYHLVTTRTAYDESVFAQNEELHQKRRLQRLQREAADLGFALSAAAT
jgi:transposase